MRNTKILLTILGSLLILLTILSLLQRKAAMDKKPKLPTPNINEYISQDKYKVVFNLDEASLSIPKELPVYKISSNPLSQDEIQSLAINLGFASEPQIFEGGYGGTTYVYFQESKTLRFLPEPRIIDYKTGIIPEKEFQSIPPQTEIERLANNFLLKYGFINNINNYKVHKYRQFAVGLGGHIELYKKPNTISLTYISTIKDYPIFSQTYETGSLNIMLNSNLDITSIYIDGIPEVNESEQYPLKSLAEIKRSIKDATIQSLDEGKMAYTEEETGIVKKIIINKISVVYLQEYETTQQLLQPVFHLEGIAELEPDKSVSTALLLPAIKSEFIKK